MGAGAGWGRGLTRSQMGMAPAGHFPRTVGLCCDTWVWEATVSSQEVSLDLSLCLMSFTLPSSLRQGRQGHPEACDTVLVTQPL